MSYFSSQRQVGLAAQLRQVALLLADLSFLRIWYGKLGELANGIPIRSCTVKGHPFYSRFRFVPPMNKILFPIISGDLLCAYFMFFFLWIDFVL